MTQGKHPSVRAWEQVRSRMDPDALTLGRSAFDTIVGGEVPQVAALQQHLGWADDRFARALARIEEAGMLTRSPDGATVTGAHGLSTTPSRHRLTMGGRALHTWCALDAVGIPAALGLDAEVESVVAGWDGAVRLRIRGGEVRDAEPSDVRIQLPAPDLDDSMVDGNCLQIVFRRAGHTPAHPRVAELPLDQAMALGRVLWAPAAFVGR